MACRSNLLPLVRDSEPIFWLKTVETSNEADVCRVFLQDVRTTAESGLSMVHLGETGIIYRDYPLWKTWIINPGRN